MTYPRILAVAAVLTVVWVGRAAGADAPLQSGGYSIAPGCDVTAGETAPGSGRFQIRVDQRTPPMYASFTLDTRADRVASGPNICDRPESVDSLKGRRYSKYWSSCGGTFSAVNGFGSFLIDRTSGRVAAVAVNLSVARWSLPPYLLGLHSGPIKVPTDRFTCAQPGLHNDEALLVNSIDKLDALNGPVRTPGSIVEETAADKQAPAVVLPRDEGIGRPSPAPAAE